MVREKRPAEKLATTNRTKRQKTSLPSSPLQNTSENASNSPTKLVEVIEDEEGLTQEIQTRLDDLKLENAKRKKVAKDFEEKVRREQTRLTQRIEDAKEKIEKRHDTFVTQMLPILATTLGDSTAQQMNEAQRDTTDLSIQADSQVGVVEDAKDILRACTELVTCYKTIAEIPPVAFSTSNLTNTFEADKDETMRAVSSAKKSTINRLQSRLADRVNEERDPFDLDDEELHLARKVLGRRDRDSPVKGSAAMGPLLYNFGRIAGKLESLVGG